MRVPPIMPARHYFGFLPPMIAGAKLAKLCRGVGVAAVIVAQTVSLMLQVAGSPSKIAV